MTRPEEDEDWTFIPSQSTPEHVRNEQTQTEETTDSDIDVLEKFDIGTAIETESIVSDFSFLRSSDLQVETCDFSDDFPDEEQESGFDASPGLKAYSHVPNKSINSQLNVILIISVAAVAGLALGNYLGWSRSPAPDFSIPHQLMKLRQLQEELSTCKEHKVDTMNSTCLKPAPRCESPVISSAIITTPKLATVSIQSRPSADLSAYVEGISHENKNVFEDNSFINFKEVSITVNGGEIHQNSNPFGHEDIIIETRKYFPLSPDEREKSGITVWLLLSGKGISRPLFTTGLRRMQHVKKSHVNPFIDAHFLKDQYKMWPEETGVSLLKADGSIKNFAKTIEIEKEARDGAMGRFWAKIMKKVYKKGRRFGNKVELEEIITDVLLNIRQEYFGHLWNGFQKKMTKLRGRKKM